MTHKEKDKMLATLKARVEGNSISIAAKNLEILDLKIIHEGYVQQSREKDSDIARLTNTRVGLEARVEKLQGLYNSKCARNIDLTILLYECRTNNTRLIGILSRAVK